MKIGVIGYNYTHDAQFVMDCPNGPGCYLFLLVKTPSLFELNGEKYKVKPGSVIIISPTTQCRYCANGETYTDDWFYFEMSLQEKKSMVEKGIILDQPHYLKNVDELTRIIHIMSYEHYSAEMFHSEIEHKYADILIMKIIQMIKSGEYPSLKTVREKNSKLTYLRTRIYNMPESFQSIEEMADFMGISRSGLQHLYKKMFGVNIMSDVINSRIHNAKRLLISTDMTVSEIAERCGYGCEYSFLRQFKKECGCTPTEYRRNNNL